MRGESFVACLWMMLLLAACQGVSESERMEEALAQGEVLYGQGENDSLVFVPELDHAAAYFADKKQFEKASHAALYNGYAQLAAKDKMAAMHSFKDAEQYGHFVNDSLTVAWAQYETGRLLYSNGNDEEAFNALTAAEQGFGNLFSAKALVLNMIAVWYLAQHDYDSAEQHLLLGLTNEAKAPSRDIRMRLLNNYAVLHRMRGEYDQSIECLRQIGRESHDSESYQLINVLNLGMTFAMMGETDSAALYYRSVDTLIASDQVKKETKVSAYAALSRFAEAQNDFPAALQYWKQYSKALDEVRMEQEQNSIYYVQRKYDYDALQNAMNKAVIHRQRMIFTLLLIVAAVLGVLAVVWRRLANIRKQESELKTELLRFMRQNNELSAENELYLEQVKKHENELSKARSKELRIMQKLAVYLGNNKDQTLLQALNYSVWGGKGFWESTYEMFDRQFPGLRRNLTLPPIGMTEKEEKIFILLYLGATREDSALLLNTSVAMVDKLRTSVKRKLPKTSI